jgi:hypothetical protein
VFISERVRDIMHDVYIVSREKVSGSLQIMFVGESFCHQYHKVCFRRLGENGRIREVCNSVSHLSFLTGRI